MLKGAAVLQRPAFVCAPCGARFVNTHRETSWIIILVQILRPLVLSCRILAAYAPLRGSSSESVRRNTIAKLHNVRPQTVTFRNYLYTV